MAKSRTRRKPVHPLADLLDRKTIQRVCQMPARDFGKAFGARTTPVRSTSLGKSDPTSLRFQRKGADFYHFIDRGASVLAVAHLDIVGNDYRVSFSDTSAGPVVHSRALDDRLGAWAALVALPALGIETDVLLTVGEEQGCSTAEFFDAPRDYDHLIQFDRGHRDVVMYEYETPAYRDLVTSASGMRVGKGSFSDISYLTHLGVTGFNFDAGYNNEHTARCHAYLYDTLDSLDAYARMHNEIDGIALPYVPAPPKTWANYREEAPVPAARYGEWTGWPSTDRCLDDEEYLYANEHRSILDLSDADFQRWMKENA